MSRLSSNARQITYTIDRFRGVNENADVSKMKHGEATYMRNYRITDAGALTVRPGIKTEQPPFENMSGAIRGMWSGRLGGVDSLVYLQGTKLYIKDQSGTHLLQGATINGTGKAEAIFFGGLLYIFTGSELYYVTSHLDSLEVVEGYVPTVSIATAPDGAGTLYEAVNKLTAKRKVRYSADGTSTTYALPEECPAEIISVQVDGLFTKEYTTGKVTGSERRQVTFKTAPAAGANNVVIEYKAQREAEYIGYSTILHYAQSGETGNTVRFVQYYDGDDWATLGGEGYTATESTVTIKGPWADGIKWRVVYWTDAHNRSEVTSMTAAEIYNGTQDTRLFIYGDGSNKVLYSGLDENGIGTASYFPDLNEIEVGNTNSPVTSLIRHKSRLLVFKETEAYSVYYSLMTLADSRVTAAFYVNAISRNVGCSANCRATGANNKVYTACYGSLYEWASTNTTGNITADDRNSKVVSERVSTTVKALTGEKHLVYNGLTQELICFSGKVAVLYNFAADAWYIYDSLVSGINETISAAGIYNGTVYFGTTDGHLKRFDASSPVDETSTIIKAIWSSAWLDFGKPHYQKYSPKLWLGGVSMSENEGGNFSVLVSTDKNGNGAWTQLSFDGNGGEPTISRCIKKVCKFAYYQLTLKTEEAGVHDLITGAVINASYTIPVK